MCALLLDLPDLFSFWSWWLENEKGIRGGRIPQHSLTFSSSQLCGDSSRDVARVGQEGLLSLIDY